MPVFAPFSRAKILSRTPEAVQAVFMLALTWGVVSGGAMGGIGIGGALLLAFLVWGGGGGFPRPDRTALGFVSAVLALGVLSGFYAIDPHRAWGTAFKLATILLPLLFLSSPAVLARGGRLASAAPLLALLLCLGLWALTDLILLRMVAPIGERDFLISKLNRGLSWGVLLSLPVLASLFARQETVNQESGRRRLASFLLLCLAVALAVTNSRSTQLGVGAALVAGIVGRFWPQVAAWGLRGAALLALIWPKVVAFLYVHDMSWVYRLPDSWAARMEIWDYMAYRIRERPLLGHGLGNSSLVDIQDPHGHLYIFTKAAASHPHNVVCQLWGELGLPGLALGLFLAFWAVRRLLGLPEGLRPWAFAAYALAFTLVLTAYNFWTDSLWAAFALTAFAFASLAKAGKLKLP